MNPLKKKCWRVLILTLAIAFSLSGATVLVSANQIATDDYTVGNMPDWNEDSLTYNGEPQKLIFLNTDRYYFQFAIHDSDSRPSEDEWVENPVATEVGKYSIWYRYGSSKGSYGDPYWLGITTIAPLPVTVTGITAQDKGYDGNTDVTLDCSNVSLTGDEDYTGTFAGLSVSATGAFADANAGQNKEVAISDITITGENAGNFVVSNASQKTTTASIKKTGLTITAKDQAYEYNGQQQGPDGKIYDDPKEITNVVTVNGLQGSDELSGIKISGKGKDIGEYDLVPSAAVINGNSENDNYEINYQNGKLKINRIIYKYKLRFVNNTPIDFSHSMVEDAFGTFADGEDESVYALEMNEKFSIELNCAEQITYKDLLGEDGVLNRLITGQSNAPEEYIGIGTKESPTQYADEAEYLSECDSETAVPTEGAVFYTLTRTGIGNIELSLEAPVCGTILTFDADQMTASAYPKFSAPEDAGYTVVDGIPEGAGEATPKSIWVKSNDVPEALETTIEGDKTYTALGAVMPKFGYYISVNGEDSILVNGNPAKAYQIDPSTGNMDVFAEATAIHDPKDTVLKKATPKADGSKVSVCAGCKVENEAMSIPKVNGYKLSANIFKYNGKAKKPTVTVIDSTGNKVAASHYDIAYADNTNAGTAKVIVTFKGDYYEGNKSLTFTINKAANTLKIKGKTVKISKKKVAKKTQKRGVTKVIKFIKKGQGTRTYKLISAKKGKKNFKKKFAVNAKTGKLTVKKKLKKGTYKVRVKVTAKGTANYKAAAKTVTITVKVK